MVYILENVEKKLTLLSGLKENNSKDITNLDTSNPQYDENKKIYEEMNTRLDTQIDTLLRSVSDVQITREIREQVLNLIKLKNVENKKTYEETNTRLDSQINKLLSDTVVHTTRYKYLKYKSKYLKSIL